MMLKTDLASVSQLVLRRWVWILFLGAVAALHFELLLPLSWLVVRRTGISDAISPLVISLSAALYVFLLLTVCLEPLRINRKQFRFIFRYPPLWLAIVLGLLGVTVRHVFLPEYSAVFPAPSAIPLSIATVVAVLVILALLVRTSVRKDTVVRLPTTDVDIASVNWTQLADWAVNETPASPSEPDLFGHRSVAVRIARILKEPWGRDQAIALVGEYGLGKSTALNWAEAELSHATEPRVLVCRISCWGISDSKLAAAHLLDRLVETLEEYVDVNAVRGLPAAYRRMMTAEKLRPLWPGFSVKSKRLIRSNG